MPRYPSWLDEVDVEAIPVQIVGNGVMLFPNLATARETFPVLDPFKSSWVCTWAMRGELDGKPALRFETWEAYRMLST